MKTDELIKSKLREIKYDPPKGAEVPIGQIGFELTEPCASCPFRSDIEPYYFQLVEKGLVDIMEGRASFSCHETDARSDYKGKLKCGGRVQHCAGAAIMLDRNGVWNDAMTRAFLEKRWDNLKMSTRVPVFKNLRDLVSRYARVLRSGKRNKYFPWGAE